MATLMQPLLVALLTLIASLSASSAQATERQHHQVSGTVAPGRDSCEHDRCAAPFYPNVLPSFNPNVLSAAPAAAITDVSSSSNVESSYYDTYFDQNVEVLPPSARTSAPSRNLPQEILPQEILRQPHCTAHSLIYASKCFQNDPTTTYFNPYRSIISLPICLYAPSDFQYALYAFAAADSRSQDARFFMKFFRHGLSYFHLILNTGAVCYSKHEPLVRVHFNGSRQMIQLCFLVSRFSGIPGSQTIFKFLLISRFRLAKPRLFLQFETYIPMMTINSVFCQPRFILLQILISAYHHFMSFFNSTSDRT